MFSLTEIILIAIVIVFIIHGWFAGFIKSFGDLVGLVAGLVVGGYAVRYLEGQLHLIDNPVAAVIVYLAVLGVMTWLVGWLFSLIDKLYKLASIIPFLGLINKFAGALLGLVEGVIALLVISYVTQRFFEATAAAGAIMNSPIIKPLGWFLDNLHWLFPMI